MTNGYVDGVVHDLSVLFSSEYRDYLISINGDKVKILNGKLVPYGDVHGVSYDLSKLLSSEDRDFLIRNNGNKVKISSLNGKMVGLYFSHSDEAYCTFYKELLEVYEEASSKGDFEVVFVDNYDDDIESFKSYFSKMPWLAIPFSDSDTRNRLMQLSTYPDLIIFNSNGNVTTFFGKYFVEDYGMDAYPFTCERLNFLLGEEEEVKKNNFLSHLLGRRSRNYLLSNDGKQVPISELEGKTVGLYFSPTKEEYLIPTVDVYNELKWKGEKFEIVSIDYPRDEEILKQEYKKIPWLSMPFTKSNTKKLVRIFMPRSKARLIIIGPDGKIVNRKATHLINEYGIDAFPFNPNMLDELANSWKAKQETQTLESLLVYEDKDFLIAKTSYKVPVADLIGKTIMFYILYADDYICSRNFTQKLIETYHDIKAKDDAFEVIFILMEGDEDIFDEFFSNMPWIAVPFGDLRKNLVKRRLKIISRGPKAIIIGPSGRTGTRDARQLIYAYGANAYPFTEQHLKHLEEEIEETVKGWPKKLKHGLCLEHEFSLKWQLDARLCQECGAFDKFLCRHYNCDACNDLGIGWCYACEPCDSRVLHPECAFQGAS